MDKSHSLSTPMIMRSLEIKDDSFWSQEKDEGLLVDETPYLNAIRVLMHLANNARPNIYFAVNLLARFGSSPTKEHWNDVMYILEYHWRTIDIGSFYSEEFKSELIGYADVEYLSDLHKVRSQTRYLFAYKDTIIFWRSMK